MTQPDFVPVSGDFKRGVEVAILSDQLSLRAILASLGLTNANRSGSVANASERKYRDSGLWHSYGCNVSVAVGCYCERDCCGHLCSLRFEFLRSAEGVVVIKTWSRNF
jgi:hypothetical protein